MAEGVIKRGEICIWSKPKTNSRILCCVSKRTAKNFEIVRWDPYRKCYQRSWVTPSSLSIATEAEKRQYHVLSNERWERKTGVAT